jgi:hypothetical protein
MKRRRLKPRLRLGSVLVSAPLVAHPLAYWNWRLKGP